VKKIGIIIGSIAMSFGLIACSGQPQPTPTVTVTEQATQQLSPQNSTQGYIEFVRDFGGVYGSIATDSMLLDLGDIICNGLNAGLSTDDVVEVMAKSLIENNMGNEDGAKFAAALITAAEKFLC
jgi:hypothetical protein